MKDLERFLKKIWPFSSPELIADVTKHGILRDFEPGSLLLRQGDFVAGVPLVMEGLVKVDRPDNEKELLLYYIQPGESCVMSFASAMQQTPSAITAEVEGPSSLILLPSEQLRMWVARYPALNSYFLDEYGRRYWGLLQTIDLLAFRKLDLRVLHYLSERATALGTRELNLTHQQIADEVGTAREVVSRTLKKLEMEGKLSLGRNMITLLGAL